MGMVKSSRKTAQTGAGGAQLPEVGARRSTTCAHMDKHGVSQRCQRTRRTRKPPMPGRAETRMKNPRNHNVGKPQA